MGYDKNQLIQYRINRAMETIEEAEDALEQERFHLAANRIYYAGYYIVSALALQNDFSSSKHYQLIGWFNKKFVKTGVVPKELGKVLLNAFETRQEGDYEDFVSFDSGNLREKLNQMRSFVNQIKELLS